ncbi:MAG: hypothetical protein ACRYF4_06360 [Janthinobacterium lividum]
MKPFYSLMLAVLLQPIQQHATAQAPSEAGQVTRTFFLKGAGSQAEQNEILTAARNIAPPTLHIFLVPTQNVIVVRGTPEAVAQIAEVFAAVDHPHRQYRLTYTITENDGGKRIGLQRYSMVLTSGERMQMKEGSRIPVITGSYTKADQSTEKQTVYLDIGLNFDSVVQEYGGGVQLKAKIEQSSLAAEKSGIGPEDPIVRQTLLQGTSFLMEGKPLSLGMLDVISSTRRLEVEATIEAVK